MSLEVRALTADEMGDWVELQHIAFHLNRPSQPEVEYRLNVYKQDLARTYGTFEDGRMIGTYECFETPLTLPGGNTVKSNAISSVTVLPTRTRRGVLTQMITRDLRAAKERGEVASILIAAEWPIYGRFGFGPATERAEYRLDLPQTQFVHTSTGNVELIEPQKMRQLAPRIFDQFRTLHAGQIGRLPGTWDGRLQLVERPWGDNSSIIRCALYTGSSGEPEGYLLYRTDGGWPRSLHVTDLITLTDAAYLALWRYAANVDLLADVTAEMCPLDEPLPLLLADPRKAWHETSRGDFLWLRLQDVPSFLSARRYTCEGNLVIAVEDPLDIAEGCFHLEGGPDGAVCKPTTRSPDVTLSMRALGALSLGAFSARQLQTAGELEEHTETPIERMFHTSRAPWCSTFF